MQHVRDLWARGGYPGQHLWGADALEAAGHDVVYGYFGENRRWPRSLSYRLGDRLGDLEQQWALWGQVRASPGAVVYAGESSMVRGLAALRRAGAWRGPLVGVVHTAGPEVRGLDVAICLSTRLQAEVIERFGVDRDRTIVAPWGPDLSFPGYASGADASPATDRTGSGGAARSEPEAEGETIGSDATHLVGSPLVVSTGKTERDTATLIRALHGTGVRARVYVAGVDAGVPPADARIELVLVDAGAPIPYAEALADLRRADIVAIPLARTDRLLALSEIADALALGKPIVMTATPAIDIAPDALGCGLTVAPGDLEGWRAALTRLAGDAELRARLGRRAREVAEQGHDASAFGRAVVDAIELAARRS